MDLIGVVSLLTRLAYHLAYFFSIFLVWSEIISTLFFILFLSTGDADWATELVSDVLTFLLDVIIEQQ